MAVVFDVAANIAGFERGLDVVVGQSRRAARSINSAFSGLSALANPFAALTTAVGVGGLALVVDKALNLGDEVAKMSARVGIGAEALQELQHAARLSGVGMEDLETGLRNLNRRLAEAAGGNQAALNLFRDLGISVRDSSGGIRDAGSVIDDFAEKIAATASPAERTRLAMEAFGRSGTLLLPMLKNGKAGLEEFRAEARRLGLVLDRDMAEQAERTKDSLERLGLVVRTNLARGLASIAPLLETTADGLARMAAAAGRFIDQLGPDATAPTEELTRRLVALRDEIENLNRIKPSGGLAGLLEDPFGLKGGRIDDQIKALEAQRASIRAILGEKLKAPSAAVDTNLVGPSAEQLDAIDKLRQRVVEAAVADPVARSIVKFREEVEKLAGTIPSRAAEIRSLGQAFEAIQASAEAAKQAITATQAASAAKAIGLGDSNLFAGLEEIEKLHKDVDTFGRVVADAAKKGVTLQDLFRQTGPAADALAAKVDELRIRFAEQPAVITALDNAFGAFGASASGFTKQLDDMIRNIAGLEQGTATFIDTAEGIQKTWTPALAGAGAEASSVGTAVADMAGQMAVANSSTVVLTQNAQQLALMLHEVYVQALLAAAAVGRSANLGAPAAAQ
jgi:hypothetical protein